MRSLLSRDERKNLTPAQKRQLRAERRAERREVAEGTPRQLLLAFAKSLAIKIDEDKIRAWAYDELSRMLGGEMSYDEALDELSQEMATRIDDFITLGFGRIGSVLELLDDALWVAFARFVLRPVLREIIPEETTS